MPYTLICTCKHSKNYLTFVSILFTSALKKTNFKHTNFNARIKI